MRGYLGLFVCLTLSAEAELTCQCVFGHFCLRALYAHWHSFLTILDPDTRAVPPCPLVAVRYHIPIFVTKVSSCEPEDKHTWGLI